MRFALLSLLIVATSGQVLADNMRVPDVASPGVAEYKEGLRQLSLHELDGAADKFRAAIRLDGSWAKPWLGLAQVSEEKHNDAEAETSLRKALAIAPNDAETSRVWGRFEMYHGKFTEAEKAFKNAVQFSPDSVLAYVDLGDFHAFRGDIPAAIGNYQSAIAHDSKLAGAHFALANMLAAQQRWPEAQKEFEAVLQISPNNERGVQGLAATFAARKRFGEAERTFRTAIDNSPPSATLHLALGRLLLTENKPGEAVYEMEKAIQIEPRLPGVNSNLGVAYQAMNDSANADRAFRAAIAANPKDSVALNNLASVLIAQGRSPEEAVQFASRAANLDPKSGAFLDTLGWAYRAQGNRTQAAATYKRATSLDRVTPIVWYRAGIAFEEAGQNPLAIGALQHALHDAGNNWWKADAQSRLSMLTSSSASISKH